MNILGQQINFDFKVEKNAFVGPYSCDAWFNGEYYIIDATMRESLGYNGIVRNVELFVLISLRIINFFKIHRHEFPNPKAKLMDVH